MAEVAPHINMHRVWDSFSDLNAFGRAKFCFNLDEPPHTQNGQRPCFDVTLHDVIDAYHEALRLTVLEQMDCGITIRELPEVESAGDYRFDVDLVTDTA